MLFVLDSSGCGDIEKRLGYKPGNILFTGVQTVLSAKFKVWHNPSLTSQTRACSRETADPRWICPECDGLLAAIPYQLFPIFTTLFIFTNKETFTQSKERMLERICLEANHKKRAVGLCEQNAKCSEMPLTNRAQASSLLCTSWQGP